MLKTVLIFIAAVIFAGAALAGWLWSDHIRIHGTIHPIEFKSADGTILYGEVYLPEGQGPFPGVVELHGSGPHAAWMFHYKIHANAFLKKRTAVLSYDKRGVERSGGNFETATYKQFVEDALAAVTALRARPEVADDRIGLYGSSEGAWFTPEVAARDGRIKFIVNRASPTFRADRVNLWEIRNELIEGGVTDEALIAAILDLRVKIWAYYRDAEEANDPLEERRAVLEAELAALDGPWRDIYGMRVSSFEVEKYRRWVIDIYYDPTPFLEQLAPPLFAVFAGEDQNVPTADAVAAMEQLSAETGKDITIKVYPRERHEMFRWYFLFSAGYPPGYLDLIGDWASQKASL